ncbi:MAG: glutamate--tRNA ligase [Candidatus Magasanikbacteria bacterium RIFOXYA2_FULL_44_8]|uniref:Glutamate--tRNA ligase n=1 Tax=Candidatus Magasanikbacteria bacterium RIFOXYA2_FULL_44_8 TaxID=1798696 RepID=A0A1F6NIR1_9BACT|nr:MAG: glutamate--tRNA ligase [Candidatus Magasanikbacteria bacterium RIFOXYA2_FULL_44_8]
MSVRTRFAPSPTGYLHIGGLRTALYAYLVAKQNNGQFLLRIEDTDRERFVADGTKNILDSLQWAGLTPDEGVVLDKDGKPTQIGNHGPYIQSQRLDIYKKYADQLLNQGDAYYCFCTSERLGELRKVQQLNKLPTGYDGHCREIDPTEAKKRVVAGEKHVVRMKMPKEGETVFNDLIRGEIRFQNNLVDDQVLMKTDGFPTYHLAVVVDDHLMEISHVTRAEEWISSTPKHLQLYKFFGWEPPLFAHLPQLLNNDRSKLSKRQGDVAAMDYAKKGYLREAMINFLAFLGWNPGTSQDVFSLDELVKTFDLSKVSKAGAVFNMEKLDWCNREFLKILPIETLAERALPYFIEAQIATDTARLEKIIPLERERVTTLAELPAALSFVFNLPDYDGAIIVWKKSNSDEAKKVLEDLKKLMNTFSVQDWNKANLEVKVGEWVKGSSLSNGVVLWPLRVALSGQQNSPGPFEIATVLGKDESLRRIALAIEKLQ